MADVYATLADGGWRNTPIAITKVVFPDGHVDNNWGKPHRVKVLSEAVTAEETSILHQNVLGRHGRALGDQLPDRRQDGHDERTRRRVARRLHPRLLDGRVDGLPQQTRVDDRRPRRTAAGRRPAGGDLARRTWRPSPKASPASIPPVQGSALLSAVLRQVREHRRGPGEPAVRSRRTAVLQPSTTTRPAALRRAAGRSEHATIEVQEAPPPKASARPGAHTPAPRRRRTGRAGTARAVHSRQYGAARERRRDCALVRLDAAWRRRTRSNSRAR